MECLITLVGSISQSKKKKKKKITLVGFFIIGFKTKYVYGSALERRPVFIA